ncbi:unnamed protein product [Cylindrotheca closterium]|uniref:Uncharacterized protein n=1 Tax=Cylindrotheca closterium TaxID=2856 RepID=A0AAD2PU40_9STRA|nr:unnamed protein product [Cylindrotheca closterium]
MVLNTIGPSKLPPRLELTPLLHRAGGGEEKDGEYEDEEDESCFYQDYEPMDHPSGSQRLKTMQRAHRHKIQTTQLRRSPTGTVGATGTTGRRSRKAARQQEASNTNRVPFHTNNPYVTMGFFSYIAYNLTDPCCGTSDWIYDHVGAGDDYDGDFEDVDVEENALFWRDYNPKRELYSLQLQVENSNLSPQKRSYLEKKIHHMSRDPLEFDFDDDDDDASQSDVSTLLTMDESLMEGKMSGMEVAVRKFKQYERSQRYHKSAAAATSAAAHQGNIRTTYSF